MIKIEQFWGLLLHAGQNTKRWSSTLEDWLKHALQQNLAKTKQRIFIGIWSE